MKKGIDHIVKFSFLLVTIFGNPLYQCLSFVLCSELDLRTQISANVHKIYMNAYLGFLIVIFVVRILIYAALFSLKKNMRPFKNFMKFYFLFIERHKYQIFGLLTLSIWSSQLEGNIVGFFIAPISFILGLIISIITIVRLTSFSKIWHQQNRIKPIATNISK